MLLSNLVKGNNLSYYMSERIDRLQHFSRQIVQIDHSVHLFIDYINL